MSTLLVTFKSVEDPSPAEIRELKRRLKSIAVETVSPGLLRVDGDETKIRQAMTGLPGWHIAAEGRLRDISPARSRIRKD